MFGTPEPKRSKVNLGVLKHDQVNISLHGHNPVLSEMIVKAASPPRAAGPGQERRRRGHQSRGSVLHRERASHAQGNPAGRQPPGPGTDHHHRGAGGNGRRLSVHLSRRCRTPQHATIPRSSRPRPRPTSQGGLVHGDQPGERLPTVAAHPRGGHRQLSQPGEGEGVHPREYRSTPWWGSRSNP